MASGISLSGYVARALGSLDQRRKLLRHLPGAGRIRIAVPALAPRLIRQSARKGLVCRRGSPGLVIASGGYASASPFAAFSAVRDLLQRPCQPQAEGRRAEGVMNPRRTKSTSRLVLGCMTGKGSSSRISSSSPINSSASRNASPLSSQRHRRRLPAIAAHWRRSRTCDRLRARSGIDGIRHRRRFRTPVSGVSCVHGVSCGADRSS